MLEQVNNYCNSLEAKSLVSPQKMAQRERGSCHLNQVTHGVKSDVTASFQSLYDKKSGEGSGSGLSRVKLENGTLFSLDVRRHLCFCFAHTHTFVLPIGRPRWKTLSCGATEMSDVTFLLRSDPHFAFALIHCQV
jgi:hypothetical protein